MHDNQHVCQENVFRQISLLLHLLFVSLAFSLPTLFVKLSIFLSFYFSINSVCSTDFYVYHGPLESIEHNTKHSDIYYFWQKSEFAADRNNFSFVVFIEDLKVAASLG